MLHLRRRVRNVRNSHRCGDDVGWMMAGDSELLRSPESGPGMQVARKLDDPTHESTLELDPLQNWLVDTMARRETK
ncbi:hypothetical protein DR73_971 [Enterobacteriaceae bacterium ATCC 29904]|uniref:hypothetical protein n=1 Tax=Leclercia pneumoniae TaxID=2815358 RepID=UPI0005079898|nr:hypothetical protein DR73_971 [Enterobacteriaceae bacterium ATCC 29904]